MRDCCVRLLGVCVHVCLYEWVCVGQHVLILGFLSDISIFLFARWQRYLRASQVLGWVYFRLFSFTVCAQGINRACRVQRLLESQ